MKKLAWLLVLMLLFAPAALAADQAILLEVLGQAAYVDGADFEGEPGPEFAWAAIITYINNYDVAENQTEFSHEQLQALYDSLFESGTLGELPEGDSQFTLDGDKYIFGYADGDAITDTSVNSDVENGDGTEEIDFSAFKVTDTSGERFQFNGTATLVQRGDGYVARRFQRTTDQAFRPDSASASTTLDPQSSNGYDAKNVMDGKLDTCWAYDGAAEGEPATLTLHFNEPTEVRGMQITPGYAKSEGTYRNNRRIKELQITLDDGTEINTDLGEYVDFDSYAVVTFDEAKTVSSVTIQVLGTYPGEKFDDVCISEVLLF